MEVVQYSTERRFLVLWILVSWQLPISHRTNEKCDKGFPKPHFPREMRFRKWDSGMKCNLGNGNPHFSQGMRNWESRKWESLYPAAAGEQLLAGNGISEMGNGIGEVPFPTRNEEWVWNHFLNLMICWIPARIGNVSRLRGTKKRLSAKTNQ